VTDAGRERDDANTDCEIPDPDPSLRAIAATEPPLEPTDECGHPAGAFRSLARPVVTVAISVGALYAALTLAGGLAAARRTVRTLDPRWICIAAVAELCCYLLLSLQLRYLAGPPANARRLAPFRTALIVFGLGSTLPAAPVEGLTLAGRILRRRRLSHRRAVLVLGLSQWFATGGLYVLAAADALVVAALIRLPFNRLLLAGAAVAALAIISGIGYLCTRRRTAERLAVIAGRVRNPRHPEPESTRRRRGAAWHEAAMAVIPGPAAWVVVLGTASGAWFADALCLDAALRALGANLSIPLLLLAYCGIAIAAEIPLLPAGLGIVETAGPAILAMGGIPFATGLVAILVYRVIGTVLPALAGGLAFTWLRLEPAPAPRAEEEPSVSGSPGPPVGVPTTTSLAVIRKV